MRLPNWLLPVSAAWLLLSTIAVLPEGAAAGDHRSTNGCGVCCALAGGACRDRYWIPPYMVRHQCPSEAYPCPGSQSSQAKTDDTPAPTQAATGQPSYILQGEGARVEDGGVGGVPYLPRANPDVALPPFAPAFGHVTPAPEWPPYDVVPFTRGAMDEVTAMRRAPPVPEGTVAPQTLATPDQAHLAKNPGDCFIYTGPFVLERTPVLAEHKFPRYFGCSMRVIPRLRLYPFLGFNVYVPNGDGKVQVASNFVFNSVPVPASRTIEVGPDNGLAYLEQNTGAGVEKYMLVRLRDDTVKIARLDATGRGVYSVYTIAGRAWAIFAHRYIDADGKATPTILLEELTNPRESRALRKLLDGYQNAEYTGYWTIPQDEQLSNWGDIALMRDARKLTGSDWSGTKTITPLDIGYFDILFEEGLTYTEPAYSAPRRWNIPLPYPSTPGEQLPQARPTRSASAR